MRTLVLFAASVTIVAGNLVMAPNASAQRLVATAETYVCPKCGKLHYRKSATRRNLAPTRVQRVTYRTATTTHRHHCPAGCDCHTDADSERGDCFQRRDRFQWWRADGCHVGVACQWRNRKRPGGLERTTGSTGGWCLTVRSDAAGGCRATGPVDGLDAAEKPPARLLRPRTL